MRRNLNILECHRTKWNEINGEMSGAMRTKQIACYIADLLHVFHSNSSIQRLLFSKNVIGICSCCKQLSTGYIIQLKKAIPPMREFDIIWKVSV